MTLFDLMSNMFSVFISKNRRIRPQNMFLCHKPINHHQALGVTIWFICVFCIVERSIQYTWDFLLSSWQNHSYKPVRNFRTNCVVSLPPSIRENVRQFAMLYTILAYEGYSKSSKTNSKIYFIYEIYKIIFLHISISKNSRTEFFDENIAYRSVMNCMETM